MRMQKRSVSSPGIRSKIAKSPPAQHPRHLFGCVSPIAERLPPRPGNRSGRFCSQAMARAVVALRAPAKMLARASSAKSIRQFAILDAAAMQQSRSTAQQSLRGRLGDVDDVAVAASPGSRRVGAKAPRTRAAEIATKPGSTQRMRAGCRTSLR
jgi:hypothetical protein